MFGGRELRKAFTLIELLVVIVIISVLAAILFPVFSQAKEAAKKSTTLSNFKQVGAAMLLYVGDHDDTYPLAWSPDNANGVWRNFAGSGQTASFLVSFPAGWRGGAYGGTRQEEDSNAWGNSILPYIKTGKVFEAEGVPHFRPANAELQADYANNDGKYFSSSVTFNGMLHNYSASAVASPSQHPMLWQGMFRRAYDGFFRANPELDCYDLATPCRFNPSDYPQAGNWSRSSPGYGYVWFGAVNPYGTAWIYSSHGMHFIQDDSSARFQQINAALMSLSATGEITRIGSVSTHHPFSRIDTDPGSAPGSPFYSADCDSKLDGLPPNDDGTTINIAYDCFFRPDSEYNYSQMTASDY